MLGIVSRVLFVVIIIILIPDIVMFISDTIMLVVTIKMSMRSGMINRLC